MLVLIYFYLASRVQFSVSHSFVLSFPKVFEFGPVYQATSFLDSKQPLKPIDKYNNKPTNDLLKTKFLLNFLNSDIVSTALVG